ncbi:hypothetical protein ACED38_05385, partial [Vibrio cortegadensis]
YHQRVPTQIDRSKLLKSFSIRGLSLINSDFSERLNVALCRWMRSIENEEFRASIFSNKLFVRLHNNQKALKTTNSAAFITFPCKNRKKY